MTFRIIAAMVLCALALLSRPSAADACDSMVSNDLFTMADSAERVLVVRGIGNGAATVRKALKGSASDPLPPIRSNCDPHLEEGADYLLFIQSGGHYYTDTSAVRLIGDRGQDWIASVRDWMATQDDDIRSDILQKTLDREFAERPLYGSDWRMQHDIASLPMPHPTIERQRERRLKQELSTWKSCRTPDSFAWFDKARAAHSIALVRPGKSSQAAVLDTLWGHRFQSMVSMKGFAFASGADYLVTLDARGHVTQPPLLVADAKGQSVVAHVRSWASRGMKPSRLRELALTSTDSGLLCDNMVHRLAYDALRELATRSMRRRDCRALDSHQIRVWTPGLSEALRRACRRTHR